MSEPCPKCGVRPNVACPHRPADESWTGPPPSKVDMRRERDFTGQGLNFGTRKQNISGGGTYRISKAREQRLKGKQNGDG